MNASTTLFTEMADSVKFQFSLQSDRLQVQIAEHYFRLFRRYDKMDQVRFFIQRWIDVVQTYSKIPHFVAFDPPVPALNRLVSRARGVVLVPFNNSKVRRLPRFTSVFPYYPFRIKLEHTDECCKIGLEFFHLYLELTDIRFVCVYKMWYQQDKIIRELREKHPHVKIYTTASYKSFCAVMSNSLTRDSKSPRRRTDPEDKLSRPAAPLSIPTDTDSVKYPVPLSH